MSTALQLVRPDQSALSTFDVVEPALQLATKLSMTEFVPKGLRNNAPAVLAAILTGHELGMQPMTSLAHIHVIDGKPGLSSAIQRALILAQGHEIWVEETTNTRAVICSRRKGQDRVFTTTYTMDDAKAAGLQFKDNWKKYPRNMLVARATGEHARNYYADVLGAMPYNTEELQDLVDEGPTDGDGSSSAPPPGTTRRRAARAATAPATPAGPPDVEAGPPPAAAQTNPSAPPPEVGAQAEPTIPPPPSAVGRGGSPTGSGAPVETAAPAEPGQPAAAAGTGSPPAPESPPPAGVAAPGEHRTLAQEIAIICREIDIDRKDLIRAAVPNRGDSARSLTREEAGEVLEAAKAIHRGEMTLVIADGRPELRSRTEEGPEPPPVDDSIDATWVDLADDGFPNS